MKRIKSFTSNHYQADLQVFEFIECKNAAGEIVDSNKIKQAEALGFDVSKFTSKKLYRMALSLHYSNPVDFTLDQLKAFRDIIQCIGNNTNASFETAQALKSLPAVKLVSQTHLLNPIDITLPNGTVVSLTDRIDGDAFLGLLPDEYANKTYKIVKVFSGKPTLNLLDPEVATIAGCYGNWSKLIEVIDKGIAYYEELIAPEEDHGGLDNKIQEN